MMAMLFSSDFSLLFSNSHNQIIKQLLFYRKQSDILRWICIKSQKFSNNPSFQIKLMFSFLIYNFTIMIWIPLLLSFGGYVAFSLLLFFFPTLLHRRVRYKVQCLQQAIDGTRILRIAHRGGPRYMTENTIQAFKHAQPICDMLEMDVCETKDGVLVVHHDHELIRTCGVQGFVRDFDYKDLPPFKEEIQLNFAPEGLKVCSKKEKIPTLQQVFKAFPQMPLNIQLKTPSTAAIKELLRLVVQYDRNKLTIVGIRSQMQEQLRQANLQGMRWMNDKDFYLLMFYYVTGLLPFVFIEEVSLQLPLFTQQFYHWKIREWGNNWKTHAYFKALKLLNLLIRPMVQHMRKRGIMTFYWVCNTQADIKMAINSRACGVMTDDPKLLNEILQNKQYNEESLPLQQREKKIL